MSMPWTYLILPSRAVRSEDSVREKRRGLIREPAISASRPPPFRRLLRDYRWFRETRAFRFAERHTRLRWVPTLTSLILVGSFALAIVQTFANPAATLAGYAMSLVLVDAGITVCAGLFATAGRLAWKEDRDASYLSLAIGFGAIPVWGLVEVLCVNDTLGSLGESTVCAWSPIAFWFLGAWLFLVPTTVAVLDLLRYAARRREGPGG